MASSPRKKKHASDAGAGDESPPRRRVTKEDVLREATRLFAEKGYDGLTMGELAERVGLRKASLFYHCPTKEALYEQVLGVLVDVVQRSVFDALAADGSFLERVDALSDALTVSLGQHPHAARLLVGEAIHPGALRREVLRTKIDAVLAAAREFVRAGQREGAFDRSLDPTQIVLTLMGTHFLPFATVDIVERFAGAPPTHAAFIDARTVAVREQVRRLLGARG